MEKRKRKDSRVDLGGILKFKAWGNNTREHTVIEIEEKPSKYDGLQTW